MDDLFDELAMFNGKKCEMYCNELSTDEHRRHKCKRACNHGFVQFLNGAYKT